jgi:hypothetical protein
MCCGISAVRVHFPGVVMAEPGEDFLVLAEFLVQYQIYNGDKFRTFESSGGHGIDRLAAYSSTTLVPAKNM